MTLSADQSPGTAGPGGRGTASFVSPSPTGPRLNEAETQVYFLLRKYRVQKHYRASSAAKVTRYAVYVHGGGQITEPASFLEAQTEANCLTARDIVATLSADWRD